MGRATKGAHDTDDEASNIVAAATSIGLAPAHVITVTTSIPHTASATSRDTSFFTTEQSTSIMTDSPASVDPSDSPTHHERSNTNAEKAAKRKADSQPAEEPKVKCHPESARRTTSRLASRDGSLLLAFKDDAARRAEHNEEVGATLREFVTDARESRTEIVVLL
jgi:hypothetical protein